jgi:hypothetical protein
MSNEIQLSNANLPLQPALTPPQVLASAGQPEATPLRRIHRLLRGRYILATVLATIGAACGVAAGIILPKPAWESFAVIQIHPVVPTAADMDRVMPLYAQYVQNVIIELHTERVIRLAMQNPQWRQLRPYPGDFPPAEQVAQFAKNLTVKQMPTASEMIQVTYSDTRADAKDVAQIAVTSVVDAYRDTWDKSDSQDLDSKILWLTQDRREKAGKMDLNQKAMDSLTEMPGEEAAGVVMAIENRLLQLKSDLELGTRRLEQAKIDRDRHAKGLGSAQTYSPRDIAQVDQQMSYKLNQLDDTEQSLSALRVKLAPQHQMVVALETQRAIRQKSVDDYAAQFNQNYFIENRNDGTGSFRVPKDLGALESAVSLLQKQIDEQNKTTKDIAAHHVKIMALKNENDQLQAQIIRDDQTLNSFQFQKTIGGQFKVTEPGTIPQPGSDRRPVFAAIGFVGGAAVPIGFLLLLGLANPRYRFSDETNTETIGLNLLGILPDLPDRLSDPEQASIAAHCVHQIRTMLQISGGTEERRVFAVTSAAPGDGKTSLTLALGLSYAACGTRTLLIDCDLVGAGLTSRMNVNAPEGVLEAIANRSLLEYVRHTDVADVSILPVGSA